MPDQSTNRPEIFWQLEDAQFIWDEYKYRHQHIWKLIFQITTAVIAVSIVPYISSETLVKTLRWFIAALPCLGAGIVAFGWSRLSKEICAMTELKKRHRAYQKLKYGIDHYASEKESGTDNTSKQPKSSFSFHVEIFLGSLFVLSILNIYVIIFVWLPVVSKATPVLK
jgi:hypothetical protein